MTHFKQLEQDFEMATTDYETINQNLKADLPRFMQYSTQFIDPLFHSFFYMQCVPMPDIVISIY